MSVLTVIALATVVVVEEEGASRKEGTISVPRSGAVVIDGMMNAAEWRGSAVVRRPEGDLLLRHDGRYLYVGVRTARRGLPSLCATRGNTVRVVHASYALGEVTYEKKGATMRRQAELRIPLDQLDPRDPRISLQFSVDDDGASDEIASGRTGTRTTWTRLRLAPAARVG